MKVALPVDGKEIGSGVQSELDRTAAPVQQGENLGRGA